MAKKLISLVSLRRISGQYMLSAALLSMLPLLALSLIVSTHVRRTLEHNANQETVAGLRDLDQTLARQTEGYKVDLRTIADYPPFSGIHRAMQNGGVDPVDNSTLEQWRARLAKLFMDYAHTHAGIQQVRYLDADGREWLRINRRGGEAEPRVVPASAMQDKSDRPYFLAAAALAPDECYVSPIDLNVEHGRIDPDNPVLRVATPLWQDGDFQGVVVINISADAILSEVGGQFEHGRIIFATESGSYMSHPDREKLWGDQLSTRANLFEDWPGLSLAQVQAHRAGEGDAPLRVVSEDEESELTLYYARFDTNNAGWIIGLERDRAEVLAASTAMNRYILITTGLVGLFVVLLAYLGSLLWVRPIKQMAAAADAIRDGDYSVRLRARRRDELGDMARSYNRMAEDLEQALELERQRAEAEASNQAKTTFLANMSHEIRTPMSSILGFADLLESAETTEQERANYIQTIRRNGDHLMCVINDILDLTKIEAGKMTVESVRTSLPELVGRVSSLMRPKAMEKGIKLELSTGDTLPEFVYTDPVRLRQVLLNLMSNAVKFTERGGVRLTASCRASEGERCEVVFEVTDTGIGIEPGKIENLFRPFNQADESTTRHFGGTGLGLTLCRQFAKLLGGDIEVESAPGRGSTFRLVVAARRASADTDAPTSAPDAADAKPAAAELMSGMRVLVAEDGKDNQRLILFHLKKLGAEAELCENGKDALDRALAQARAGRPFDLVLMDMQMPVMDGYTATRLLRDRGYPHRIVALTAHAMSGDREKCLAAGCDDYATKPIGPDKLRALLSPCVDGRHAA